MARLTGMGRLNSKSRKVQICSPKKLAIQFRLVEKACNTKPKFSAEWMVEGLRLLKRKGYIEEQWLNQDLVSPIKYKEKILHFGSSETKNGIRGWDKLNGIKLPID